MKKASLFIMSGIITSALLSVSYFLKSKITEVDILQIQPESSEEYIVCPGRVEYGNLSCVYHNSSAIVKDIKIKPGDKVSQGDKLMSVNNIISKSQHEPEFSQKAIDNPSAPNSQITPEMAEMYRDFISGDKNNPSVSANSYSITDSNPSDIIATESGTIVSINTKLGETISPSTPIISIAPENSMQVRMCVNESKISCIKEGQTAKITGTAFKGEECIGKVSSISNEAKQVMSPSGNETVIDVLLNIEQKTPHVKPGFTTKCKIITNYEENILTIPHECVLTDNSSNKFVYSYYNGIASKKYIQHFKESERGVKISSDLQEIQYIVSDPEKLSGDNIRVKANFKEGED